MTVGPEQSKIHVLSLQQKLTDRRNESVRFSLPVRIITFPNATKLAPVKILALREYKPCLY